MRRDFAIESPAIIRRSDIGGEPWKHVLREERSIARSIASTDEISFASCAGHGKGESLAWAPSWT